MNPIYLDTSALVRYFTGDDKEKAEKTASLLKSGKELFVLDVVLVELEYVLKKLYGASREELIKVYTFLVGQRNIKVSGKTQEAIGVCTKTTLSLADCLIVISSKNRKIASFDEKLLKIPGIQSYW